MAESNVTGSCRPIGRSTMTASDAAQLERLFKTVADRHRVRILNLLANSADAICVCEFQPALGLSQPSVSYHLGMLTRAGFLQKEKRGRFSYYRLVPGALEELGWAVLGEGPSRTGSVAVEPKLKRSGHGLAR